MEKIKFTDLTVWKKSHKLFLDLVKIVFKKLNPLNHLIASSLQPKAADLMNKGLRRVAFAK